MIYTEKKTESVDRKKGIIYIDIAELRCNTKYL